jgi:hypothetical protein
MLLIPPLQKVYFTLFEAQCITGKSQHTWRSLIKARQITCIRAGRRTILIPKAEIERYLQQHTVEAVPPSVQASANQTPANGERTIWRLRLTRKH